METSLMKTRLLIGCRIITDTVNFLCMNCFTAAVIILSYSIVLFCVEWCCNGYDVGLATLLLRCSTPVHATVRKLFTRTCASVTRQYNFLPIKT